MALLYARGSHHITLNGEGRIAGNASCWFSTEADDQGCYDIRPPCNPANPTGMGLDNAYCVNLQTGRAWGVDVYPGGLPALYANGVKDLMLSELRIRRPTPLPQGWNACAIEQENADA